MGKRRVDCLFSPWSQDRFDRFDRQTAAAKQQIDRQILNQLQALNRYPVTADRQKVSTSSEITNQSKLPVKVVTDAHQTEAGTINQRYETRDSMAASAEQNSVKPVLSIMKPTKVNKSFMSKINLSENRELKKMMETKLEKKLTKEFTLVRKKRYDGEKNKFSSPREANSFRNTYSISNRQPTFSNMLEGPMYIGRPREADEKDSAMLTMERSANSNTFSLPHAGQQSALKPTGVSLASKLSADRSRFGGSESTSIGTRLHLAKKSRLQVDLIQGIVKIGRRESGGRPIVRKLGNTEERLPVVKPLLAEHDDFVIEKPEPFSVEIFNLCRKLEAEQAQELKRSERERLNREKLDKKLAYEKRNLEIMRIKNKNEVLKVYKKINTLNQTEDNDRMRGHCLFGNYSSTYTTRTNNREDCTSSRSNRFDIDAYLSMQSTTINKQSKLHK